MNTHPEPPKWALDFLEWFCPDRLHECILGDLLEQFDQDEKDVGEKKARQLFVWNVIRFFRPGILFRNSFKYNLISTIMLSNYFKVAMRNIMKRKLYSFINAFGLSIGIAFCILIYLYIQDERSFDQFHTNKDRIYRLEEKAYDVYQRDPEKPYNRSAYIQTGVKNAVEEEFPEVEMATRYNNGDAIIRSGDKIFKDEITYVDAEFFSMFSFPLLAGNKDKIFEDKYEVVITPTIAEKYFGSENPLGKTLEIEANGKNNFTVTGIIKEAPDNSSLEFKIIIPQENRYYFERNLEQWGNFSTPTFVMLHKNTDMSQFEKNLDHLVTKYMNESVERWHERYNVSRDIDVFDYTYSALGDIHLNTAIGWTKVSDPQYSMILGGIAILILIIACINYISLALTTSTSRRIEVGIRKAVGAQKNQLISQFGMESVTLAIFSMIIGIGLVVIFLPFFNEFTNKAITLADSNILQVILIGFALTILIGALAGSYPALFLSKFKPSHVLKGSYKSRVHAGFTKPLVVIQFAMSAFLIISSVIMYKQMQFITTKNLGYNKEQVLVVPTQVGHIEESNKMVERFRQRLSDEPTVASVAGTSISFNQGWSRYGYMIEDEQKYAYVYAIDPFYLPTLDVELIEGRNFNQQLAADSNAIIINEALAKDMGWTDPLNEHLNWREDSLGLGSPIIGVVKDYHFLSLQSKIEPMFLSMDKKEVGYLTSMLIKIGSEDLPGSVEKIRGHWNELAPDKPFEYSFLDEDVAKQYSSYERWMNIMSLATGFAILISCLGLFGLSGINAVNKTKEIGIRKVLGAELMNIFVLLNRQYIWLAVIAFVIAAPLSWYVMDKWLSDFTFAISMSWELFVLSMATGLVVALLTVSYHAINAALINPADTLKCE